MTDSWWLKVQRAEKHLKEIKDEVRRYSKLRPYELIRVVQPKRQRHVRKYTLRITEQPDPMLAVVVGDFVHNLRSALDHVAVACVPRKRRYNASFPICIKDPFAARADGTLLDDKAGPRYDSAVKGMAREARAIIEGLQPHRDPEPGFTVLAVLTRLENADKHRTMAVVAGGLTECYSYVTFQGRTYRKAVPDLRDDGTEFANFVLPAGAADAPESEVSVEARGTVVVTVEVADIDEKGAFLLPGALDQILVEVSEAIERLEPYVIGAAHGRNSTG